MPRIRDSLRTLFRREGIGDLSSDRLRILVYLRTHSRKERALSASGLKDELGVHYKTVVDGFRALLDGGFIALAPDAPKTGEHTDPQEFVVTAKGKRALRPLLNVFGLLELMVVSMLMLVIGVLISFALFISTEFPSYWFGTFLVTFILAIVFGAILYFSLRSSRREREQLVSDILVKQQATDSRSAAT